MHHSSSRTFVSRQYRLANGVLTLGVLSAGMLILGRLIARFHDALLLFYGVSEADFHVGEHVAGLPINIGQFSVAIIGIVGICGFIVSERVNMQRTHDVSGFNDVVIERMSMPVLVRNYVKRSLAFSGVLLLGWLLQASYINMREGLGWGLGYSGWKSIVPIVLIFGLCVGVGLVVAAISMLGVRVMRALEAMIYHVALLRNRRGSVVKWLSGAVSRTARERFGLDILSRPPPMCAM